MGFCIGSALLNFCGGVLSFMHIKIACTQHYDITIIIMKGNVPETDWMRDHQHNENIVYYVVYNGIIDTSVQNIHEI